MDEQKNAEQPGTGTTRAAKMAQFEQMAEMMPKLFKTMGDSLPEMITKIMRAVYSEEVGHEYGKSVAAFYKALKESGIPESEALALAREFIVNQQQLMKSAVGRGGTMNFGRPGAHEAPKPE